MDATLSKSAGVRKAAILVASLDDAGADAMLRQLPAEMADAVRTAVAVLDPIDPDERQRVIDEFLRVEPMVPENSPPGLELDSPLAARQMAGASRDELSCGEPERADVAYVASGSAAVARDGANQGEAAAAPFSFLSQAEDEKLAHLFQNERPQTVALVLAHLPAQRAGGVLARFSPDFQIEVVRRLADLDETAPAVLQEVEHALEARLSQQFAMQQRRSVGVEAVAAILDACDAHTSGRLLDHLAACDRTLAEKLGLQTLTFEDLPILDDAALAAIVRAVDPAVLRTALIGAAPLLVERILQTMTARDAKRIRKHVNNPGPLRLSDVDQARQQIVAIAQRMLRSSTRPASAA